MRRALSHVAAFAAPSVITLGAIPEITYLLALDVQLDQLPVSLLDFTRIAIAKVWIFGAFGLVTVASARTLRGYPALLWTVLVSAVIAFLASVMSLADHLHSLFQASLIVPLLLAIAASTGKGAGGVLDLRRKLLENTDGKSPSNTELALGGSIFLMVFSVYVALSEAGRAMTVSAPTCNLYQGESISGACLLRAYDAGDLVSEGGRMMFIYRDGSASLTFGGREP